MNAASKMFYIQGHAVLSFIRVLCIPALLSCMQACHASETTLRIGYILSRSSQLGAGVATFAEEVSKRTDKRYRIEQYPDAMLGGEVSMMRAVQNDALDLVFVTGASLSTIVRSEGIFNIPYLFRDAAQARATLDGPIGQEYLAKFEEAGLVGLAWGENGMRQLTNSKRNVVRPADIAGLRLRLPQSEAMSAGFQAMGASVTQLPFNQLYGVLQSGAVDAQENPIATIVASHFAQVQDHLTMTAHSYDPAVILMSRMCFETLSQADREAMLKAAHLGGAASRAAAERMDGEGLAELQAEGVSIVRSVDKSAFARAVAPAEQAWSALYGASEIARVRSFYESRERPAGAKR